MGLVSVRPSHLSPEERVLHLGPFVCLLPWRNFFVAKYVSLSHLSVCHTIFGHSFQAIVLKFFVCVGYWPRTATLNFGQDPNPDLRSFLK